ncbi:hypothetical protein EB796_023494 [Bugula neritina]|uniref:Uncharacterized protein n=1 Tax=Bugula neritina TaxID=10212 RepID=A0A7J7IXR0_BUGNE|nr:hypothetical protein EB796_023494 [Bugula neritina]
MTSCDRKSSKPEIKIAEPRPACEGRDSVVTETSAASLKRHQSGKTTSSNTSSATDRKSLSRSGSVSAAQGVADDDDDSNSDLRLAVQI